MLSKQDLFYKARVSELSVQELSVQELSIPRLCLDTKPLEEILGYTFKDRTLLIEALTPAPHCGRKAKYASARLSFLGDRVLGLLISDLRNTLGEYRAFSTLFPNCSQAALSAKMGIPDYLEQIQKQPLPVLGSPGWSRLVGEALEALVAAVHLDCGDWDKQREVVYRLAEFAISTPGKKVPDRGQWQMRAPRLPTNYSQEEIDYLNRGLHELAERSQSSGVVYDPMKLPPDTCPELRVASHGCALFNYVIAKQVFVDRPASSAGSLSSRSQDLNDFSRWLSTLASTSIDAEQLQTIQPQDRRLRRSFYCAVTTLCEKQGLTALHDAVHAHKCFHYRDEE